VHFLKVIPLISSNYSEINSRDEMPKVYSINLPKLEMDADVGDASIKTNRRTKKLENRLIPTR